MGTSSSEQFRQEKLSAQTCCLLPCPLPAWAPSQLPAVIAAAQRSPPARAPRNKLCLFAAPEALPAFKGTSLDASPSPGHQRAQADGHSRDHAHCTCLVSAGFPGKLHSCTSTMPDPSCCTPPKTSGNLPGAPLKPSSSHPNRNLSLSHQRMWHARDRHTLSTGSRYGRGQK